MQPLKIWMVENTINLEAESGEILQFPATEPGRLVAYLRGAARPDPDRVLRDLEREERARQWAQAWREKGAETRTLKERRKAKEAGKRKGLLRRANAAQERKEQLALLKLVGL
jgi:hypothetical protein